MAMNCPIDGTRLEMSERRGIEVDYCPSCRGVWLDRGELDKIIERNERSIKPYDDDDRRYDDDRSSRSYSPPKKKKRTSFLSELFEGGD
jgi:Zn-finger nucleic acid-binding protein